MAVVISCEFSNNFFRIDYTLIYFVILIKRDIIKSQYGRIYY